MSRDGRLQTARRWVTSPEAVALSGIACAVQLSVSAYLLGRQPGVDASEAQRVAWYGDAGNRDAVLVAVNLAPIGAISFLWFMAVIRRRLGERDDRFFSTVFLCSGLGFVVLTMVAAAVAAAPTLTVEYGGARVPSQDTIALAHGLWLGLFGICASRLAAVFVVVTSTVGIRFGALPRWASLLGYVLAVVLFVAGGFSGSLDFIFPVWLTVVSATILVSHRARGRGAGQPLIDAKA